MNIIIITIVCSLMISIILYFIKNKSNFPKKYIIPVITAIFIKYVLGDWDKGYNWSYLDYLYWPTILLVSYLTISLLDIYII